MTGWGWRRETGKEERRCGHPGIEGEGWTQGGERDERSFGIASGNGFGFSSTVFSLPLKLHPLPGGGRGGNLQA